MLSIAAASALVITGVIHLLPLSGVLGADQLSRLYGLTVTDPSLTILMRHRAVLFGLLGAFLILAALKSELRTLAFVAGLISVATFIWLAWVTPGHNAAIRNVVIADWVALVALVAGAAAHLR
jgi:hypothetical protein